MGAHVFHGGGTQKAHIYAPRLGYRISIASVPRRLLVGLRRTLNFNAAAPPQRYGVGGWSKLKEFFCRVKTQVLVFKVFVFISLDQRLRVLRKLQFRRTLESHFPK